MSRLFQEDSWMTPRRDEHDRKGVNLCGFGSTVEMCVAD